MNKRDQLNQLLNEERKDRKTVEQLCADWGWTLSDKEATIVNNQIVINKGKVVEVPVVKEVQTNDNEAYIQQLLKDLENRNNRIEELKALLEREQQLYKDLEFEANEEIDAVAEKRDKEIAKLKAENEKLKNDFIIVNNDLAQIEVNYELIKQDLSNKVDRIDELELHVEELQGKIDMLKEELQYFDGKEEEYNNDVTGMEQDIKELEEKLAFKELLLNEFRENMDEKIKTIHELENKIEGMKFGYENKIAKLKEEANKPQIKIEVVDDPAFNDEPEEKPVTNNKPMNNPINLTYTSLHVTHDAIKAIAHDKANGVTFHFVWKAGQEKLPCYSATGARGTWSRMNGTGMYRYGKQVVEDFKQLAEEKIISKAKDNKVKTTKVKETKVTIEKPEFDEQEIVVNVTEDKHVEPQVDEDPLAGADEMEFW